MSHRLRKRTAAVLGRVALAAVSMALALVAAELALRLVVPSSPAPAEGGDGQHGFIAHDPDLGWRPVAGASGRIAQGEFDVAVALNEAGMRGPRTYSRERRDGVPRAVVVGDSFSFGYGVRYEETWVTRVEDALAPAEVINLAVTGYGTDQQLMRLEREGLAWQPDLVIVGLFEGNIFRNARREQVGFAKPRFVLGPDDELRAVGVPVPRTPPPRGFWARTALGRLAGAPARKLYEHLGGGEAWPVTRAILARTDALAREHGAALLVVVIPKDQAVHGSGLRRRLHQRTLAEIRAMLDDLAIAYLDLTPVLAQHGETERLYFHTDGHWNAAGHRVAAEAVVARLRAEGWLEAAVEVSKNGTLSEG